MTREAAPASEAEPSFEVATARASVAEAPLRGVRVLDLTRVIAGPVCTRLLAAYGADVLRIDPPGFEEVGALLGDATPGKRCAALDLRAAHDRDAFERLVGEAHVLVHGYRSDALDGLGLGAAHLRQINPGLLLVSHDAYGWTGPWAARRGFDSLVQMSVGIAARGAEVAGTDTPHPLPAQALDHGTGYLLAAATCRLLTDRLRHAAVGQARLSLARTATFLIERGETGDPTVPDLTVADAAPFVEHVSTGFGPMARVRIPGTIEGVVPRWPREAGPLGRDVPAW
jgi:crotonobetainyl-CoA:carnitine CoA-transferase CaiB-like acyl-CoA transferase